MKHLKQFKMEVLLYSLLVGICAIGGFWGTYKLSQALNRNEIRAQAHGMPDLLFIDVEVQFEVEDKVKQDILRKVGSEQKSDTVHLSTFFDTEEFKINGIAKNNYNHFPLLHKYFETMRVTAILTTPKTGENAYLIRNSEPILLTSQFTKSPKIEILNINKNTGILTAKLSNIQMDVETQSDFLYDFKNGNIELHLMMPDILKPIGVKQLFLKSRKTSYFLINTFKKGNLGFEGKLKSLV